MFLGKENSLGTHSLAWWPTIVVLAVAVVTDLRSRRIPNWLVIPFLIAGVLVSPWRHDWWGIHEGFWQGLGQSCSGVALGFLIFGIGFWMGGMGGGDVKLAAAIGAWVGPLQSFYALLFTSLVGGVMILCWFAYVQVAKRFSMSASRLPSGGGLLEAAPDRQPAATDLLKRKIPYAPAIAIGTLMSFFALAR